MVSFASGLIDSRHIKHRYTAVVFCLLLAVRIGLYGFNDSRFVVSRSNAALLIVTFSISTVVCLARSAALLTTARRCCSRLLEHVAHSSSFLCLLDKLLRVHFYRIIKNITCTDWVP